VQELPFLACLGRVVVKYDGGHRRIPQTGNSVLFAPQAAQQPRGWIRAENVGEALSLRQREAPDPLSCLTPGHGDNQREAFDNESRVLLQQVAVQTNLSIIGCHRPKTVAHLVFYNPSGATPIEEECVRSANDVHPTQLAFKAKLEQAEALARLHELLYLLVGDRLCSFGERAVEISSLVHSLNMFFGLRRVAKPVCDIGIAYLDIDLHLAELLVSHEPNRNASVRKKVHGPSSSRH